VQKVIYLFGLARAGLLPDLQTAGLDDDAPLLMDNFANVTAILCEVPLEEFQGPSAETRLKDLAWVGPKAVRHERVIEHAMQHSPVLPARFGTLFSSRRSLYRLIKANLADIDTFLDRVADKDEWAVKGLSSKAEARERLLAEKIDRESEILASMSPGMRYFKERQIQAAVQKEIGQWIKQTLQEVAVDLSTCSADWYSRKIVLRVQEGTDKETVVNWAFLVGRSSVEDFSSRIHRANAEYAQYGLLFELSGPWPPYSFAPQLKMEAET
jgi:hypothetical protein